VGAKIFVIDVAHGASIGVARQYNRLRQVLPKGSMIAVGNFATRESASDFLDAVASHPDFLKVGIGNGAACETRQVAGVGVPQLDAIHEIHDLGIPIIADGGIRNPSDLSKSLAAGASLVMIGSLFAGCEESPGQIVRVNDKLYKEYRGSAAFKSYQEQGKVASHRAAEGAEGLVQYQGTVAELMQHLTAGLRSSMSYTGAFNLAQFREKAILAEVSGHTLTESKTRLL
jgi:IMP dehydrogenase